MLLNVTLICLFSLKLKLSTSFSKVPILESNQNLSVTWKLSLWLRLSNHERRKSHEFCVMIKDSLTLELRDIEADTISLYACALKHIYVNYVFLFFHKRRGLSYSTAHCCYLSVPGLSLSIGWFTFLLIPHSHFFPPTDYGSNVFDL